MGLGVDIILTSPLSRAMSTAQIAAAALNLTYQVTPCDALSPAAPQKEIFKVLNDYGGKQNFLLVGHEPDLSSLAATLLGAPSLSIRFKKGGLCHIEIDKAPPKEPGTLIWHLTPDQLRELGKIKSGH